MKVGLGDLLRTHGVAARGEGDPLPFRGNQLFADDRVVLQHSRPRAVGDDFDLHTSTLSGPPIALISLSALLRAGFHFAGSLSLTWMTMPGLSSAGAGGTARKAASRPSSVKPRRIETPILLIVPPNGVVVWWSRQSRGGQHRQVGPGVAPLGWSPGVPFRLLAC